MTPRKPVEKIPGKSKAQLDAEIKQLKKDVAQEIKAMKPVNLSKPVEKEQDPIYEPYVKDGKIVGYTFKNPPIVTSMSKPVETEGGGFEELAIEDIKKRSLDPKVGIDGKDIEILFSAIDDLKRENALLKEAIFKDVMKLFDQKIQWYRDTPGFDNITHENGATGSCGTLLSNVWNEVGLTIQYSKLKD